MRKVRDEVETMMYRVLKLAQVEFFLGGSKRFGYDAMHSDVDIHVLLPNHGRRTEIIIMLESLGFKRKDEEMIVNYPDCNAVFALGKVCHIIIHNHVSDFNRVKVEHDVIDKYLAAKPDVLLMAKKLRSFNVSGNIVYQTLLIGAHALPYIV